MEWGISKATYETITPKEFWDLSPRDCCAMARRMSDGRFQEMLDYPLTDPENVTYAQSIANIMSLEVSTDFKREPVQDGPFGTVSNLQELTVDPHFIELEDIPF